MNRVIKWGVAVVLAGLTLVVCKVTSSEEGSADTIYSAKFESGEVSGWNSDETYFTDGYVKFTASDMVGLVNGGAEEYIAKGMSEGFRQDMAKGDQTYQSWILDFGTAENALDMYNTKVQQFASTKETAGNYPETKAFVTPSAYGYDGYAVFGKFMVVLWLDGFGANKGEAKDKTVDFMETIESKIAELNL